MMSVRPDRAQPVSMALALPASASCCMCRLPAEMIPEDRDAEADLFAELGLLNSDNAFLKHLKAGKIEVVRGVHTAVRESQRPHACFADHLVYCCSVGNGSIQSTTRHRAASFRAWQAV